MYATGLDPFTLKPVFVEKDPSRRERQKRIIVQKSQENKISCEIERWNPDKKRGAESMLLF